VLKVGFISSDNLVPAHWVVPDKWP